jgi:hypothetical protein
MKMMASVSVGKIRAPHSREKTPGAMNLCWVNRLITVPPLPPGYLCAAIRRVAREEETGTTC